MRSSRAEAGVTNRTSSNAEPYPSRLVDAATQLDGGAVTAIVHASLSCDGVVSTWQRLILPTMAVLQDRRDVADVPAVAEILYRRTVFEVLSTARRPRNRARPSVLLACADEEHEALPLEAVAAALAEMDTGCTVLGARVPPHALLGAISRSHPAVVVIWSQTCDTADPDQVTALLSTSPEPAMIAAGPGWHSATIPQHVAQPLDVGGVVASALALLQIGIRRR